jgi:hypothetical protein
MPWLADRQQLVPYVRVAGMITTMNGHQHVC